MASDFVWAIDENGRPTKCRAKPENRGKRNCNHRFHAAEGQSEKEFFDMYVVSEVDALSTVHPVESPDIPSYEDVIPAVVESNSSVYKSWQDAFSKNINDWFTRKDKDGNIISQDVQVSFPNEYTDPEDPTSTIVEARFEYNGRTFIQPISIPRMDESNEIVIGDTAYRCIPIFFRDKKGVVTKEDIVILKDLNDKAIAYIDKATGLVTMDRKEIDHEDLMAFINGRPNNLTEEQRERLSSLDPICVKRLNEEGIGGLCANPEDMPNDISYRPLSVYEDRVCYTVDKHLRSTASILFKKQKKGTDGEYDFSLGDINTNIRKDLLNDANIQLSDNLNPISALTQSEKVSFCGNVGYSRESVPDITRFPHESHRGVIDVSDTTSGKSIGTVIALKGKVGAHGLAEPDSRLSGKDFIPYMENSDPQRASMAVAHMRQAVPIVGGEDPKLSTKGWDAIKGSKLGINMNVVYMADAGTYEDAVVISESVAKKMTTVQRRKFKTRGQKHPFEVGDEVRRGTFIGGKRVHADGVVCSVNGDHIEVETIYPMTVGDKIAGRYGNKGVVSKILPDSEMPMVDGKPADIMMSPVGVAGRANLGQVYEVNGGKTLDKKKRVEYQGRVTENTAGEQFVMRLNHIAEAKIQSAHNQLDSTKQYRGGRLGSMETLLLSHSKDRLKILDFIKTQEHQYGEDNLNHLLKSIGVAVT